VYLGLSLKNMKTHNFIVPIVDTDSITVVKPDMSAFTQLEIDQLTEDLNSHMDELINWEFEFNLKKIIAVRAKNYVLWDGDKVKTKGSSLKATVKSPAMKEFIQKIIWCIIEEKYNYVEIYNTYVKEIMNITDITRFAVRKTITNKVMEAERTSAQKLLTAISGEDDNYSEGDKAYVYYKPDDSLALADKFDGQYNQTRLLKNLFDTALCFETIIDKTIFTNYSLKKNQKALHELLLSL